MRGSIRRGDGTVALVEVTPAISRVCGNCRFFDERDGACHKKPPVPRRSPAGDTGWPKVAPDTGWCGAIQPRAELIKTITDASGHTHKFPAVFADDAEWLADGVWVYLDPSDSRAARAALVQLDDGDTP